MGIKGFGKLIEGLPIQIKWSELSNKSIAIDAMWELYSAGKAISGSANLVDSKGNNTGWLKVMLNKILKYMRLNIVPVYVFENKVVTPLKLEENTKRKDVRNKDKEKIKKLAEIDEPDGNDALEYNKMVGRLFKVDETIIKTFQKLLRYMGIPYITSPKRVEGEKLCVYLQKDGFVDYIYTKDIGDVIAFRGQSVMMPHKTNKTTYVDILYADDVFKKLDITYERFVEISVALGTDFAPKSPGIGIKTAFTRKFKLTERQLEAKEYFMNPVTKKFKYKHYKWNRRMLILMLDEYGFSDESIDTAIDVSKKYHK